MNSLIRLVSMDLFKNYCSFWTLFSFVFAYFNYLVSYQIPAHVSRHKRTVLTGFFLCSCFLVKLLYDFFTIILVPQFTPPPRLTFALLCDNRLVDDEHMGSTQDGNDGLLSNFEQNMDDG